MRHTDYKAFFEGRCARHKELKATGYAFSQLFLSRNPMQQELDMAEFWSALRHEAGMQVVLQNYDADYEGNDFDTKGRWLHGAFLVLDRVENENWPERDEVISRTERIAEELVAGVAHDLNSTYRYLVTPEQLQTEAVANVSGYSGVRVSFSIKQLAVPSLTYKPDLFD